MSNRAACPAIFAALALCAGPVFAEGERPVLADAERQFTQFVEAFRNADDRAHWKMLDPRKRRWIKLDRWRKQMAQARRRQGNIASVSIIERSLVQSHQLPCTEMGHCYRKGVTYAVFLLRTTYVEKQVKQPEFAVMSWSDEGWRFAGGTFPATAMGETGVLLDDTDDKRFRAQQHSRKIN